MSLHAEARTAHEGLPLGEKKTKKKPDPWRGSLLNRTLWPPHPPTPTTPPPPPRLPRGTNWSRDQTEWSELFNFEVTAASEQVFFFSMTAKKRNNNKKKSVCVCMCVCVCVGGGGAKMSNVCYSIFEVNEHIPVNTYSSTQQSLRCLPNQNSRFSCLSHSTVLFLAILIYACVDKRSHPNRHRPSSPSSGSVNLDNWSFFVFFFFFWSSFSVSENLLLFMNPSSARTFLCRSTAGLKVEL